MMILNSIEMPTGREGVVGGGKPPGNPTKNKMTLTEFRGLRRAKRF